MTTSLATLAALATQALEAAAVMTPTPGESPKSRPKSPPSRPAESRVIAGESPESPLSPRTGRKTHSPAEGDTRRRWLLRHPDGTCWEHSFHPPATLAEVQEYYPDATVEPFEEPPHGDPEDPAKHRVLPKPATPPRPRQEATQARVSCSTCQHWVPNRLNPRGGLGSCKVNAPASMRPGSLWPAGEIVCREWAMGKGIRRLASFPIALPMDND